MQYFVLHRLRTNRCLATRQITRSTPRRSPLVVRGDNARARANDPIGGWFQNENESNRDGNRSAESPGHERYVLMYRLHPGLYAIQ